VSPNPEAPSSERATSGDEARLRAVEAILDHRFGDPGLLREALTHSSAVVAGRRRRRSNERLEFLGDRVLGLVVAERLLHLHPQEPEGDLSRRLEALVRMTTLAEVAETLGIGAHLTLARGEHEGGGRDKPNILADALEALIGALYLDGGLEPARNFVLRHWSERASSAQPAPRDPKMALQEWAQAQGIGLPRYAASAVGGPDHAPSFEATVTLATLGETSGTGGSKRAAEKAAAEAMLQKVVGR